MTTLQVKYVKDLKRGEKFIWADHYTRDFMTVYDGCREYSQVLTCLIVDRKEQQIKFECLDGTRELYYYDDESKVILVDSPMVMHPSVKCENCHEPFHRHFMGTDPKVDGICCGRTRSGEHFIPAESELYLYHMHEMENPIAVRHMSSDDFFTSIGL